MKAITLTAPWSVLIATQDKRVETRSWPTSFRGPLAIHTAKTIPDWVHDWARETTAVQTMLLRAGYSVDLSDMPLGCVVATCQLVGCVATEHVDWTRVNGKERILGNFAPDRYAFLLQDVVRVDPPVPARGALQLWEWDAESAGVEVLVTGRLF